MDSADSKPLYITVTFYPHPCHSWFDQGRKQIHRLASMTWHQDGIEPIDVSLEKCEAKLKTPVSSGSKGDVMLYKVGPGSGKQMYVKEHKRMREPAYKKEDVR